MKKLLSLCTAFLTVFSLGVASVSAINDEVVVDENGYLKSNYGTYIVGYNEIVKCVCEESVYLKTAGGTLVYEFDKDPSMDELNEIKSEHLIVGVYILVNDANPHVNYVYEEGSDVKIINTDNVRPYISYEFDGITHELKDYRTGKVITKFSDRQDDQTDMKLNTAHPAYGELLLYSKGSTENKDKINISLSKYIYYGSNENSLEDTYLESPLGYYDELYGDLNYDQKIDITDLSILSLYLIGDNNLTSLQYDLADVDASKTVTLADLARLQQYLSKKITSLG